MKQKSWKELPYTILLVSIIIRIGLLILPTENVTDLNNYFWAANTLTQGDNPYLLWANNISGPRSDLLPAELALLAGLVSIYPDPFMIRIFIFVCEIGILLMLWRMQDGKRRNYWLLLYGLGPSLYYFVYTPNDKSLLFLLILFIYWQIDHRSQFTWLTVGLLAALKWLGCFIGLPILHAATNGNWSKTIREGVFAAAIFIAWHGFLYPSWWIVYWFRAQRMSGTPFHSGITVVLDHLGIWEPWFYQPISIGLWLIVTIVWYANTFSTHWAAGLSIFSLIYFAPDITPQMIWFLALILLLAYDWSPYATVILAAALFHLLLGIADQIPGVGFAYGSIPAILLSQLIIWTVLSVGLWASKRSSHLQTKSLESLP